MVVAEILTELGISGALAGGVELALVALFVYKAVDAVKAALNKAK